MLNEEEKWSQMQNGARFSYERYKKEGTAQRGQCAQQIKRWAKNEKGLLLKISYKWMKPREGLKKNRKM